MGFEWAGKGSKDSRGAKGEERNVYKITKMICGKYSDNRNILMRDKQGQLLTSEKDQEARWVEQFKEVLDRSALEEEPGIPETEEDLRLCTGISLSSSRYQRKELCLNVAADVALSTPNKILAKVIVKRPSLLEE